MEYFAFKQTEKGIEIDRSQFPDAVKFIEIDGEQAKCLADLALHREDLKFALQCLEGTNLLADKPNLLRQGFWRSVIVRLMKCLNLIFALECIEAAKKMAEKSEWLRQGLWHSAIVHFMKCFGCSKSRVRLDPENVYEGETGAMEVFNYFKALRDKHLVHDDNSYAQCLPGAILNKEDCDHKIAKIICPSFISVTLDQAAWSNLHTSITHALKWVDQEFGDLCDLLSSELEQLPYDDLLNRKEVEYSPPKIEEIDKRRAAP